MRVVSCFDGFKVVDINTQKTLYKSSFRIDCEQYIFAMYKMRKGR